MAGLKGLCSSLTGAVALWESNPRAVEYWALGAHSSTLAGISFRPLSQVRQPSRVVSVYAGTGTAVKFRCSWSFIALQRPHLICTVLPGVSRIFARIVLHSEQRQVTINGSPSLCE